MADGNPYDPAFRTGTPAELQNPDAIVQKAIHRDISLPKYAVVEKRRVMSTDEADALNGEKVPEREPDLTASSIVVDADTQQPILGYLPLPGIALLRRAVLATEMTTTYRAASGMSNVSRTFGMAPRKPTQWREACAPTSLARDRPDIQAVLSDYADVLASMMHAFVPAQVSADADTIQQVMPEWRLTDEALWTSGVINKTSQLPYHRDRFNFDAWSAMPCLRRGTTGGYLHLPEYDMTVACRDGYGLFWNGYQLLHGVTPITVTAADGYRFTIVYYALRGMKDCFTYAVEQEQARKRRTGREKVEDPPVLVHDDESPYSP